MAAEAGTGGRAHVACIAAGGSHSMALVVTDAGTIPVSWGRGEDGQLGHGDAEERLRPQAIFGLLGGGITSVHCGAEYSIAVSSGRNELYSWGWGDFGRLGHGDCKDVFVPSLIPGLAGRAVASVSCGDTHTLVATSEGQVFAFGRNQNGQLGHGSLDDSMVPLPVEALRGRHVSCVAAGAEHSVCSTSDGAVYAWGWGRCGNLGDGATQDRHTPTKVLNLEAARVVHVACGWRHTLAVDSSGAAFSWGWSKYGQLGHGDRSDQALPKRIEALGGRKVALVEGGWRHTVAADDAGQLWAWGWNKFGQLGLGHNEDACHPTLVEGLAGKRVTQLASGWKHTLVVTDDGGFYCWGRGVNGQLGSGGTQDANAPVLRPELSAGTIQADALMKEAHPVVMYAVPPSDRFAVVPDKDAEEGAAEAPPAVPEADAAAKRQKI